MNTAPQIIAAVGHTITGRHITLISDDQNITIDTGEIAVVQTTLTPTPTLKMMLRNGATFEVISDISDIVVTINTDIHTLMYGTVDAAR